MTNMTTLEPQFAPLQEFEESPGRIDGVEGVETPSRVDLRELPLGILLHNRDILFFVAIRVIWQALLNQ